MSHTSSVMHIFGKNAFDNVAMIEYLPHGTYIKIRKVIDEGKELTPDLANDVAEGLKKWAIAHNVTHYTHWFQPMTEETAEKHECIFEPDSQARVSVSFSGKILLKGETDASSLPSGGLRSTFEARGYTTWDCTSPPVIKPGISGTHTLLIPTAFCSYTGEALDRKTPLLRSMRTLNNAAVRLLQILGYSDVKSVIPTIGCEQEYFLIDKKYFQQRKDLVYSGRTLFGAPPSKGQELEDQYFAPISQKVAKFMRELDRELWKLGVPAKTQHYEVAPSQYEIVPLFANANIGCDHNQLIMEMLRTVAERHNMVCLLHEKPYKGLNGSGKHNNWSMKTNTGINLLDSTNADPLVFKVFCTAVIVGVHRYSNALRMATATRSNEQRLGGHEAPPSIISVFTGSKVFDMLSQRISLENKKSKIELGVPTISKIIQDDVDRNRTSPFAFTSNKFEFRMVGSSQSPAVSTTIINTVVADTINLLISLLEGSKDPRNDIIDVIEEFFIEHSAIVFNGDNYSEEWIQEAKKRKISIIESTVDAINEWGNPELVELFERNKVLSAVEMESHRKVELMKYAKNTRIEAKIMLKAGNQLIVPAVLKYLQETALNVSSLKAVGADPSVASDILNGCNEALIKLKLALLKLEDKINIWDTKQNDELEVARFSSVELNEAMEEVRNLVDKLELVVSKKIWPFPSYDEIIWSV